MTRTIDNTSRALFNANALKQDSTFKVLYFKVHGLGANPRAILAASGAKWECVFPKDWFNEEKNTTLFGVLPNLFETTLTGEVIEVAESDAIENYLCRKFNLLGNDAFDEMKIRAFCCSINSVATFLLLKVAGIKDPEVKAAMRAQFVETVVPRFVTYHERHLEANGRNGHYVGDKLSFADIKLAVELVSIFSETGETLVNKQSTPAIWAVWEMVNAIPSYAKWAKSEVFQACSEGNMRLLGY
ncbi:hypothetical protein BGZ96_006399 [Linnemannia gamsii]|uniref:glutathione transferase n=1 Tax=Linnemannia gamsii TaxID=64522 RepID=A0ABQ7KG14_9FUNG|nr:hypothetical protein BGZ96_006399 [Linnemannia gamsii]